MRDMDERTKELAQGNIPRLLARLSIPAVIGMFIEAIYNVVDRMFVGRAQVGMAGPEGLAGLTICFPLMTLIMGFTLMVGAGGGARISLALGRGDRDTAENLVTTGFFLSIIIGLVIMVIGLIFLDPILRLFGADDVILPYAREYMRIILYGSVFNILTFSMNRYIVAQGRVVFAMLTLMIGCAINFVLDPLFIFVFEWGVAGAAWATVIAWFATAVWVVSFFVRKKGILSLKIAGARLSWDNVISIASIGVAPFSMQVVTSLTGIIMNNSLRVYGGAMAISAMGAIQSVLQLFQMPLYGLNNGSQPITGFNYGAKNYTRVRETFRLSVTIGTLIGTLGFVLAMCIPHSLIGIFGSNPEMISIGARSMRIFLLFFPAIGILILGASFFSSTGRPQFAMMIMLGRQTILIFGLLLLPRLFALDGVFAAGPVADGAAVSIAAALILREWKRLKRIEAENPPPAKVITNDPAADR